MVSVSQPPDCGFEPHLGHDHDSSYDLKYWLVSGHRHEKELNKL